MQKFLHKCKRYECLLQFVANYVRVKLREKNHSPNHYNELVAMTSFITVDGNLNITFM